MFVPVNIIITIDAANKTFKGKMDYRLMLEERKQKSVFHKETAKNLKQLFKRFDKFLEESIEVSTGYVPDYNIVNVKIK